MIKYIIHEGYIISKNDGDAHFIKGEQLIKLYRLKRSECEIIRYNDKRKHLWFKSNYIHLYPKFDGNYNIEKVGREF